LASFPTVNRHFRLPHKRQWSLVSKEPPRYRECPHKPYFARNYSHWATSSLLIVLSYLIFIQIFVVGSERRICFETHRHNGPLRSFKVVNFGTNRKHICDFLLVINSNLGLILSRFRDIAAFLLRRATPPLFHPNFGVFPLGQDCRCCESEERRPLGNYSYNYFRTKLTQHICPTVHQRYRRTDRQTDGRLTTAITRTCIAR